MWRRREKESISGFVENRKLVGTLENFAMARIIVNNNDLVPMSFMMCHQFR